MPDPDPNLTPAAAPADAPEEEAAEPAAPSRARARKTAQPAATPASLVPVLILADGVDEGARGQVVGLDPARLDALAKSGRARTATALEVAQSGAPA